MPQKDRYKPREVPIEFIAGESFNHLPYPGRYTLVFITSGELAGVLNGNPLALRAPAILCLNERDEIEAFPGHTASAQSFCFSPGFFDTVSFSPEHGYMAPNLKIETGLSLFAGANRTGVPRVTASAWPRLFEWFFILGTEVYAQSDERWVCRIKKYLIQILGMLEELSSRACQTPVEMVQEYIHTHYAERITLEDLTACAHLNRVSLNKLFQQRFGTTAMGYLQAQRQRVAEDMLTHTGMSLNEIARATGFVYDTYFIKQFTAKKGMTPTEFRNSSRSYASAI